MLFEISVMGLRCGRHFASRDALFWPETAAEAISQIETS